MTGSIGAGALALGIGMASGHISSWIEHFYFLLDPTCAKNHAPLLPLSSFVFDFHILLFFCPAGLYLLLEVINRCHIFIILYSFISLYFAGIMIRLILVVTPAVCLVNAIATSASMKNLATLFPNKPKSPSTIATKRSNNLKGICQGVNELGLTLPKKGYKCLTL